MASIALPLTQRPEWKALEDHYHKLQTVHLQTLFGEDPGRGERFAIEAAGAVPRLLDRRAHQAVPRIP